MMGVEALAPLIGTDQATPSSGLNFAGNPFSAEDPLKLGPRHCIQSSAESREGNNTEDARPTARGRFFMGGVVLFW
jgi:hypothetical protein